MAADQLSPLGYVSIGVFENYFWTGGGGLPSRSGAVMLSGVGGVGAGGGGGAAGFSASALENSFFVIESRVGGTLFKATGATPARSLLS